MNWIVVYQVIYIIIVILVCIRIIYDTRTHTKSLAYLLLVIFVPVIGILFYFSIGINYRKRKLYSKKLIENEQLAKKLREDIFKHSGQVFNKNSDALEENKELAYMLVKDTLSPLTANNSVKIFVNGENKFPEVLKALEKARHHIHIEYYIYDDDEIGRTIEEVLVRKSKEGVEVRFIYDDFGSRSIRKAMAGRLNKAGIKAFPFHRIRFIMLANRLNYRNHRKIIVIDGQVSFIGGINVSDRYINSEDDQDRLFWRDTHVLIEGPGVHYLQYLFLCDWNFCSGEKLQPDNLLFPKFSTIPVKGNKIVQITSSGPDSDRPTILFSMLQAIYLATQEILITTPYFIPPSSLLDALVIASLGGVKVKLLVPGHSDSVIVNAAAFSYYNDLLKAGVEVYLYKKGFVHAKTIVSDRQVAIIGTANMDNRSFDLNFEVAAIIYDKETARELCDIFYNDLKDAEMMDPERWNKRPEYRKFLENTARLISPLL